MPIKTLMRSPSGVVEATESLAIATRRLASEPDGCLLVRNRGRVVGVLTMADVRAAGPSTIPTLAAYESPSLTAHLTVADALRGEGVVVPLNAAAADVARALRTRQQRVALVADGADVVGVVTTEDLLSALTERLERDSPPRLARLLVAVSPSPTVGGGRGTRTVLDIGLEIGRRHGATVTLLHVMRRLSPRIAEGLPVGGDSDVQRWRLAGARASLARLVPTGIETTVRTAVRAGEVVDAVLAVAAETLADLIVMGGRRGSALVRETICRARCPVLAV